MLAIFFGSSFLLFVAVIDVEVSLLVTLWTFDAQAKLERFTEVLKSNNIEFEVGNSKNPNSLVTLSVEEDDYEKAKKLLMKHKKRRTSRDLR